jgi:hypothetical protein
MRFVSVSSLALLLAACCPDSPPDSADSTETGLDEPISGRGPYRDIWREELVLPAAALWRLIVGGRLTNDNFANRGDIEILHVEGNTQIVVQLQRFTFASSAEQAEDAFARMSLWAYALAEVQRPDEAIASDACGSSEADHCQLRTYYDGLFQPSRDGANMRVILPRGWTGELELVTEDNLLEGDYSDRGDVLVDGLAGKLSVELDSGRARVRLDSSYEHYPGCPANDSCVEAGMGPDCGCSEFGYVRIEARDGQAADIVVDVPSQNYYSAMLHNDDPQLELGCSVEIDCESFPDCALDPDFEDAVSIEQAAINDPGPPAVAGSGIHVDLHSGACAMIDHAEAPVDWIEGEATEVRGSIRLCSGCW